MCGIAGLISETFTSVEREHMVREMNKCLAHRGPDNDGFAASGNVALGHRRLSIIDISKESDQPFYSADKRFIIVYNGELYNYKDLKLELQRAAHGTDHKPYFFQTASDTEVVLAAYIRWGKDCLRYFNGMFAFAIHDTHTHHTFLARDKMGIKPLYYHFGEKGFIFSSEVRAILKSGIQNFRLNKKVLNEYVQYQTVFAPETIIQGIKMLLPGHFLEYENGKLSSVKYYDLNKKSGDPNESDYSAIKQKTLELLTHSVQRRLVADVPFGAFLSGGIDSSAIVALMSSVSAEKVNTFNVSFDESRFSESQYARIIAQKFNTRHTEIKLSPQKFLDLLPEALLSMDHPGGDGPNTYIVSKATKEAGISMALSGIGGDEIFAGYPVFKQLSELRKKAWLNAMPKFSREAAAGLINIARKGKINFKVTELLRAEKISFQSAYPITRTLFSGKDLYALSGKKDLSERMSEILSAIPQYPDRMLSAISLAEIQTYLQNILLRDTDQMSMAVALEVREPFLDHNLVEYVLSLNDDVKYPSSPKKLLVDALGGLLPSEIVNRPKMGFTLPWEHWMKNELKSFCEKNIDELETKNLFVKGSIKKMWIRFINNDPGMRWSQLWHLIVLNNWIHQNKLQHQ